MDSIYVISINLCNIWKEGVTAHFSEEHAEAPRGKKSLARGPALALAEPCFPHWLVGWTRVLEGPPGRGLCPFCPQPGAEVGGCRKYLEGGRDREAHEAGAEVGLAQHCAQGGHEHQPVPHQLQVGSEPPAKGQVRLGSVGAFGGTCFPGHKGCASASGHRVPATISSTPKLGGLGRPRLPRLACAQLRTQHTVGAQVSSAFCPWAVASHIPCVPPA